MRLSGRIASRLSSIYEPRPGDQQTAQIGRQIIGRMQRISNDVSTPVPGQIIVGDPVPSVFNINDLQQQTVHLFDDVNAGTAPTTVQAVWGGFGSDLANLINSAKYFSVGRCSFSYSQAGGGTNDLNVSLNVLWTDPNGASASTCVKNDFISFVGAQITPISLGEIQDMFFEIGSGVWEPPSSEAGAFQFGSLQFLFEFRVGTAAFEIRDAYVPLQLFF